MRSPAPFVLLSVVAAAHPLAASAQSAPEDPGSLLSEGVALRRDGRNEEALDVLRRALEASRTGRALAETGYVERSLGRWLDAEAHLAEALLLEEERWVRHHRRDIQEALDEVRASIGRLRVTSNVEGAEVRVNGVLAGRTPLREPVRVGIGQATVELRLAGYRTSSREVAVSTSTDAEAHVSLERDAPAPEAEPPPPPPQCPPGLTLRDGLCFAPPPPPTTGVTAPRVLMYGGGGVALVTAAIALGVWAGGNGEESDYLAACGGRAVPPSCEERYRTTQASLDGRATAVTALWVVSGVALAAGVTGLLLELKPWQRRTYTDGSRFVLAPNGFRVRW
ncbi:MAG: PEGA domain-containing protein [Polyangiales bacterium]